MSCDHMTCSDRPMTIIGQHSYNLSHAFDISVYLANPALPSDSSYYNTSDARESIL